MREFEDEDDIPSPKELGRDARWNQTHGRGKTKKRTRRGRHVSPPPRKLGNHKKNFCSHCNGSLATRLGRTAFYQQVSVTINKQFKEGKISASEVADTCKGGIGHSGWATKPNRGYL